MAAWSRAAFVFEIVLQSSVTCKGKPGQTMGVTAAIVLDDKFNEGNYVYQDGSQFERRCQDRRNILSVKKEDNSQWSAKS
jgi:hypothetical protein